MIIIIIGISISDISHNSIIYNNKTSYVNYDKVPKDLTSWPDKINVKCWCCREFFKTRPVPIPTRRDKSIVNKGVACSLACGKSYILTYKDPDINQKNINVHLRLFQEACEELGYDYVGIVEKPHFYESEEYGY